MMMGGGRVLPADVCHSAVQTPNATAKTAGIPLTKVKGQLRVLAEATGSAHYHSFELSAAQ
jgi:hypothetical protein